MTGITRCKAAKTIAKLVEGKIEHLSDTYDTCKIFTQDDRCWKVVRDASIRCERKNGLNAVPSTYSVELVSPILKYESDINLLQEIV